MKKTPEQIQDERDAKKDQKIFTDMLLRHADAIVEEEEKIIVMADPPWPAAE